jgi:hypothetical protein
VLTTPALTTIERRKVPAEFRGAARVFRDEVKRIDKEMDRALATIAKPLVVRLRRHPRLRHELIAVAVHQYRRTVPVEFRFGEVEVTPDRDAFEIAEIRATATWINSVEWDSDAIEAGIAVARCTLTMRPTVGLVHIWMPRAVVSMHAIARWFERSGSRDHDRILADLAVLADSAGDGDHVATPGGFWRGEMEVMEGTDKVTARARNVRTWVNG